MTNTSAAASVAAGTSSAPATSGADGAGLSGLTQADFIKLLTAQMQNQDPTSPTKPQDLANEFAQLSTVSGINALNAKVDSLGAIAGAAELGQASNLIGKTVAVAGGSSAVANADGTVTGGFSLSGPASTVKVQITDPASGKVMHTLTLHDLPAGLSNFSWTGGSAGYAYAYDVAATSGSSEVAATTYHNATVRTVNLSGGAPTLSLAGATQPVDLSQIVSVLGG
ncbi:flagellar hook capping FlgD N-terminal domain-containing protein [uncultured Thioclava sp.]|jgi:flagellar basal-body rod modification protein FlgD|uniref:Basal-body rod modification protein FlgD n=1 Tax=Thioclava arctica TaxID=3238301 RepID=A0ABV3TNT7_9RHOB|nr:flagellar hook capping FlgD N-terminal domain-containing protein [uncultured Thioclava sp.]